MAVTTQYWNNAQKLRFVSSSGVTYVCVHNPTTYNMVPLTKAQASIPVQPGPNILSGGIEFASGSIPIEWPEMDFSEWQALQAWHLVPSTMIDMYDNGYLGWLVLGSYQPPAGVATKVGKANATFVVAKPANGLISTVNVLAPITITSAVAAGGSIPASTTLHYALSVWTPWGESLISPDLSVSTGGTSNAMITISWTAPVSNFYRKARLYVSTSAITAGTVQSIKAEVYSAFTQSFVDYCGMAGLTSTATTPTTNQAYTGRFSGGIWYNMT